MTTLSKLCSMQMCAYCTDITDSEYIGVGCFIHVLATWYSVSLRHCMWYWSRFWIWWR